MAMQSLREIQPARIVGVGDCTLDYFFRSATPRHGESAPVIDTKTEGGGLTGTATVACARLGAQTEIFCRVGTDDVADTIMDGFIKEKVGVRRVYRAPRGKSPVSFVHVDLDSGERTIYWYRDNTLPAQEGIPADWLLEGVHCLLVDATWLDAAISAADAARRLGIPVVADTVPSDANRELLARIDVLIAPASFARKHIKSDDCRPALKAIHELGPSVAVITLGKAGSWYSERGVVAHVPAFEIEPVVDTTGAGDVFHGAFAFATAQGWPIRWRIEFASAVAALKCRKLGGRAGIPSLGETLDFLAERGSLCWKIEFGRERQIEDQVI